MEFKNFADEKCEILINDKIDNSQINTESLDYLLKNQLYLLNSNNLENYQKIKNKTQKQQKKLNKKINQNTLKNQEKYSSKFVDEYLNKTIENINSLNRKLSLLKIEKDDSENQNNLFYDIKKINKYLSFIKEHIINKNNVFTNNENNNIEPRENINFNNQIVEKISKIDNMLNTIFLFEENNFLKKDDFLKETKICFKLLNEKIIIETNENSNKNIRISSNENILNTFNIGNLKNKEIKIINNLELIEEKIINKKYEHMRTSSNLCDLILRRY